MTFTPLQTRLLDFCKRRPVFTLEQIRSAVGLAPLTIRRALKHLGYFCSFNHNARYYTWANRPRFDANGLWFYRSIGFSRHRTLTKTLLVLVHNAAAGATPEELTDLLRTPVGNLLACLARQQQLARRRLRRRVVYLAADLLDGNSGPRGVAGGAFLDSGVCAGRQAARLSLRSALALPAP